MKLKEEKLDNLKKQIAGAFKDNSWERQVQIEELTKELKRVQEESDLIKHKLKGYKNKNSVNNYIFNNFQRIFLKYLYF